VKEIFLLIRKWDMKGLFLEPTDNGLLQFFRYAFVGAIASVVDWGVLWVLEKIGLYYLIAAIISFFAGLATNFFLSKLLVFNGQKARMNSIGEFVSYAVIGAIGLGMTLGIMYVFTEWLHLYFLLSKIIATLIVLVWNYLARKIFVYGSKK